MKFEIDVTEFWIEDGELEKTLKAYIIKTVTANIEKSIKDRIEKHIEMKVKAEIEERMYRFMNTAIEDIIKNEKMISNNKSVTLAEYIKEYFQNRNSYRSADDTISREAQKFASEMKNRYDLLFASQLVAKMSNAGMLKEDVAKILLEQPK